MNGPARHKALSTKSEAMDSLPDELIEKIVLLAGVGASAVCKRFRDAVMANVVKADVSVGAFPYLPKLRTLTLLCARNDVPATVTSLDISAVPQAFEVDAVQNMTASWSQLSMIRRKGAVQNLKVAGHSYDPVDMSGFVNLLRLEAYVVTNETFECMALPWLEALDLECEGDFLSADVVMPLLPRNLKELRLAGIIDTFATGEALELRHFPTGLRKLDYVVDCWALRLARSKDEFAHLSNLTLLESIAVPAGTPVDAIPIPLRHKVANTMRDGFYRQADTAKCRRHYFIKANQVTSSERRDRGQASASFFSPRAAVSAPRSEPSSAPADPPAP